MCKLVNPYLIKNSVTKWVLQNRLPPEEGLADKKFSGVKGKKIWLTYAFTPNADGS